MEAVEDISKQTGWSLVSTHFLVLACVVDEPTIKLTEIAESVGITVRQVSNTLAELIEDGFVIKEKNGRRNVYTVVSEAPFDDGLVSIRRVSDLLDVVVRVGVFRPDRPLETCAR